MASHARALPDLDQVRTSALKAGQVRNPHSPAGIVEMSGEMLISVCFDEACIAAGLSNKAIAASVGISSDSMVSRWRSPEHKDCPSLVQILKLGPDFLRLMHRGFSRRCGWQKRALLDIAAAMTDAVLLSEE